VATDPRSVLGRKARDPDLITSYGPLVDHAVDVWLPANPDAATLVIFLHGGFWRSEYDRAHVAPLAEALAGAGYLAATPEYRRTGGGGGWPATFDDVRAAVAAVPGLVAAAAAAAPVRTLVAGHSAGGHLALWVAGEVTVDGVVALAPVADLRETYRRDLDGGAVVALLGGGPHAVPERYAAADPMARLPLPVPVALVHGRPDRHVPVSFSQHYARAALASGAAVRLDLLPDADHFAVIDPQSAAWPAVMSAFAAYPGPSAAR
jgi:acetyl esterase/lipase